MATPVTPQPVDVAHQLNVATLTDPETGEQKRLVALVLATPVGQHVVFLDPAHADALAAGLQEHAMIARTGIIPAALSDVPPHVNGFPR